MYNGPLLHGFNVRIKGLNLSKPEKPEVSAGKLFNVLTVRRETFRIIGQQRLQNHVV